MGLEGEPKQTNNSNKKTQNTKITSKTLQLEPEKCPGFNRDTHFTDTSDAPG